MEITIQPGQVLQKRYRFEYLIGYGAHGHVWRVWLRTLQKPRAIKVISTRDLSEVNLKRAKRECMIGGKLESEVGIVQVFDAFEELGQLFIVMELMEGGSLQKILNENRPEFPMNLLWALELCDALAQVHDYGIIHRDIKPHNILFTKEGHPKIGDFGIAHLPQTSLTEVQPGTPGYQAPELELGRNLTPAADVYSLCAVFFELWGGRSFPQLKTLPKSDILQELSHLLEKEYPDTPLEVRKALSNVILEGLDPDPASRLRLEELRPRLTDIATQLEFSTDFYAPAAHTKPSYATFIVPFPRNRNFFGREDDLEKLLAALQKETTAGVIPAMLTGLGGVGKTQLAVEYAYRYREEYSEGVYWINASQDWLDELINLAVHLRIPVEDVPGSKRKERLARIVLEHLNARENALLIFDNVEDPRSLQIPIADFVPTQIACHLMFTTRRRDIQFPCQSIEVRVLPTAASMGLLLHKPPRQDVLQNWNKNPQTTDPDVLAALSICRSLGYLPLALALAAAYLGKYPRISLSGYLERLKYEGGVSVVDASGVDPIDLPTRHDTAVAATLGSQWDVLENDTARRMLQTASLLGEAAEIPRARLALLTGLADNVKPGYPTSLDDALYDLHDLWLIEELTDREIRLHPLVQQYTLNIITDLSALADASVSSLVDALWKPPRLNFEIKERGVDAVLNDINAARNIWLGEESRLLEHPDPNGENVVGKLTELGRVINLEAHHLRQWDPDRHPGFCLQQLLNRTVELDISDLQLSIEANLSAMGLPFLYRRSKVVSSSHSLLRTLQGHNVPVLNLTITPDNKRVVSAARDCTLKVWELETGKELLTLEGHTEPVLDIAVTSCGFYAISASADTTLKKWDLRTGQELGTCRGHQKAVSSVVIEQGGVFFVSASSDKTIKVWDMETCQEMGTVPRKSTEVHQVAFTKEKNLLVSVSGDGAIIEWNLENGRQMRTVVADDPVWNPDFEEYYSPDIPMIIKNPGESTFALRWTVSEDGCEAELWDLERWQRLCRIEHFGFESSTVITPDGDYLISVDYYSLKISELETSQLLSTLYGHSSTINDAAITTDGHFVVSASDDGTLKIWDLLAELKSPSTQSDLSDEVMDLVVTPDGCNVLVIPPWSDVARMIDAETGDLPQYFNEFFFDYTNKLAITSDGQLLLSGFGILNRLTIYDLHTLDIINEYCMPFDNPDELEMSALEITSNSQYILTAVRHLQVWELETCKEVHRLCNNAEEITDLVITPDDRFAIAAFQSSVLKIWDIESGVEVCTLDGHDGSVNSIALTSDGNSVVSGSSDRTIKVWDLKNRCEVNTLLGHCSSVTGLAVTPDDGLIASVSEDQTVRIWDFKTQKEIIRMACDAPLTCCQFALDGTTLIVGDKMGTAHLLELVNVGNIKPQPDW